MDCRQFSWLITLVVAIVLTSSLALSRQKNFYSLSTEEYPPYSYFDPAKGEVGGIATHEVQALMKRAGMNFEIKVYPWLRAYNRTLKAPRRCVFSTARTAPREELFHWIGPIVKVEWALIAKKGTPADKVRSLEDARPYLIGGLEGDASLESLKAKGFKTESVVSNWLNRDKLEGQRIQLWVDDPAYIAYQIQHGATSLDYEKVYVLEYVPLYLACNIRTPSAEINRLKEAWSERP